uniref:Uncharacterized protein n=1 Tax=Opuntia streptacantha TaxID=393608 RepID=A0A7C9DFD1_OPUST
MPHGPCQTSAGASRSLHLIRQGLHFQLFSSLFIQMMKKSSQMLAGPCRICLMEPMTKSRLLLKRVFVHDLWNFYFTLLHLYSFPHSVQSVILSLVMTFRLSAS